MKNCDPFNNYGMLTNQIWNAQTCVYSFAVVD